MNREPGFSSDFAASNASTLAWLVFGAIIIVLINSMVIADCGQLNNMIGWMQ